MVLNRITNIGKTLWNHKKKAAAGGVALFFLGKYLYRLKREGDVRAFYAKKALKFGQEPISPEERPRRVTVLANVYADNSKSYDKFKTNALPLLNLAGLEVTVIRAESDDQLETLAAEIDSGEADALYIVGGDGTLSRALSGIFKKYDFAPLPMGIFPGGENNRSLLSLVPAVFSLHKNDVRKFCESAMALIEERKRTVSITKCSLEGFDAGGGLAEPVYGLSDLHFGWFLYMELRKKKLWYWGGLKRRFVYFWEMLKHYPYPLQVSAVCEEFCPGCSSCRPVVVPEKPKWKWWYFIFGSPAYKEDTTPLKDYSTVINENCRKPYTVFLEGTDIIVETLQTNDTSKLRARTGGLDLGRFGVMQEGWKRCKAGTSVTSPNPEEFYQKEIDVKAVTFSLDTLPALLRKFSAFGEIYEIDGELANKKIRFEATDKKIDLYLPTSVRVTMEEV